MNILLVSFLVLEGLLLGEAGHCDRKYKPKGLPGTHTACLDPSPKLLESPVLSDEQKDKIVEAHNYFRRLMKASDMLAMTWDDELAMLAKKWAVQCPFGHDKGPLREAFGRFKVGQNIWYSTASEFDLTSAVKDWYDEIKDFTYNGNQKGVVGHYTQVVWAKSFKVGCGVAKCKNVKYPTIFVCNYGPAGNILPNQYKPYKKGSECAECPGHCSNGLCDCQGLECQHGTLNLGTCTCDCPNNFFYTNKDCQLQCNIATDKQMCKQFPQNACKIYANIPGDCPKKCFCS